MSARASPSVSKEPRVQVKPRGHHSAHRGGGRLSLEKGLRRGGGWTQDEKGSWQM